MKSGYRALQSLAALSLFMAAAAAIAQTPEKPFQPYEGQAGKDVIWVPTPTTLVEKMLDMAEVTPQDFVVDLGSGDGRNVIAAAKRGARGLGVEYNPDMVALSKRAAADAGVADKAMFVEADMFQADISQATVLALFLLPENLSRLTPKFLALRPGTRIVLNSYDIEGWSADKSDRVDGSCITWCSVFLYIVPAQVGGTWRVPQGELTLAQNFQLLTGTWSSEGVTTRIENGRLLGDQISFSVGAARYQGRVRGDAIEGEVTSSSDKNVWRATRTR